MQSSARLSMFLAASLLLVASTCAMQEEKGQVGEEYAPYVGGARLDFATARNVTCIKKCEFIEYQAYLDGNVEVSSRYSPHTHKYSASQIISHSLCKLTFNDELRDVLLRFAVPLPSEGASIKFKQLKSAFQREQNVLP